MNQLVAEQKGLATLLAKFRIEFKDLIIIPDVTKKATQSTKAEFDAMIAGVSSDVMTESVQRKNQQVFTFMQFNLNFKCDHVLYFQALTPGRAFERAFKKIRTSGHNSAPAKKKQDSLASLRCMAGHHNRGIAPNPSH